MKYPAGCLSLTRSFMPIHTLHLSLSVSLALCVTCFSLTMSKIHLALHALQIPSLMMRLPPARRPGEQESSQPDCQPRQKQEEQGSSRAGQGRAGQAARACSICCNGQQQAEPGQSSSGTVELAMMIMLMSFNSSRLREGDWRDKREQRKNKQF